MIKKAPLALSRILYFVILTSIVFGFIQLLFFEVNPDRIVGSDYISYLTGGQIVRKGVGRMIYDIKTQTEYQTDVISPYRRETVLPFKGPPFLGLLFMPLTHFPIVDSFKLFFILNLILLSLFTLYSVKIFTGIKKFDFWFLVPFMSISSISTLTQGQISFILSFLVLFLYISIKSKRNFLAGLFTGLLLFKPQYIVAAPLFFILAKDKKRFFYGFALTLLLLVLVSIYVSGLPALFAYPTFLLATETPLYGSNIQHMFTLNSTLYSLPFISSLGYQYSIGLNIIFYFVAVYFFIKRTKHVKIEYSFISATLFFLLFAAHVHIHDLSILIVSIYILLNEALRRGVFRNRLIFLAALLFLLPFIIWAISPPLGTVIAFAAAFLTINAVPKFTRVINA